MNVGELFITILLLLIFWNSLTLKIGWKPNTPMILQFFIFGIVLLIQSCIGAFVALQIHSIWW